MRWWRRPTLWVNSLLAMFVLAGAGWSYLAVAGHSTAAASSNPSTRQVSVSTGTVTATVSASGSVQSANTAAADFVTAGTVTEIDAKVGDLVTKGQVLAKVDPTAAQETLNTAQANLQAAKDALSVAQADSTSAAATISAATAQVSSAQATVDADQRAVDGTVLTAPMAGTVTAVNGSVGNSSSSGSSATAGTGTSGGSGNGGTGTGNTAGGNASSGNGSSSSSSSSASSSGFIQLSDLTQLQVSASFAESDATKLKVGQTADVTWSALSGTQATGKVASISPTATASGGVNSYPVVVSLDSVPDGARLGQTTTVVVTVAQADSVVRVPVAAVTSAGGRHTVRAVSGGTTSTVAIQVGVQGDTYDEVTSGLSAGQVLEYTVKTSTGTGTTGGGGGFGGGGFGGAGGLGGAGGAAGAGGGLGGNRGGGG